MAPTPEIICKPVPHNSADYAATVALRDAVLRRPLGLTFDPQDLAREADSFHLTCWIGPDIVGCVVLSPAGDGTVRLRQMAVATEHQRSGIGTRLVRYAEEFLREKGCREIVLHARETAVGFYERLGYRKEGERFTEVTLPHFVMRKELP